METITRANLAEAIYAQVGLSRNESADLLENVLERISAVLESGESVKISSFGTFLVRQKGQRIGRNPKTGVLSFRPSQVLKARINNEEMEDEA
jgi:integration host factor subunit alpha